MLGFLLTGQQCCREKLFRVENQNLEPSSFVDKAENLFCKRHEVGAAMASNDDCAARISHSRGPIEIPALQVAVKKASGKSVTRSKHVAHFYLKRWYFLFSTC